MSRREAASIRELVLRSQFSERGTVTLGSFQIVESKPSAINQEREDKQ